MNLIQFTKDNGKRAVGVIDKGEARVVKGADSVYRLALKVPRESLLRILASDSSTPSCASRSVTCA